MAVDLIKDMSTSWQPEKYHNEYRETMQQWLDQQTTALNKKGKKVTSPVRGHDAVVDFVSLLKESMNKKKSKEPPKKRTQAKK